jgi:hypothetical protein
MTDLLGDPITPQSLLSPAHGFDDWWKAWPSGPRKADKKACMKKWAQKSCAQTAIIIFQHTQWMKAQEDWLRDNGKFICAPLVYLNREPWTDWEPIAVPTKPAIDPALAKIATDRAKAVKAPDSVREAIKRIRVNTYSQSMRSA